MAGSVAPMPCAATVSDPLRRARISPRTTSGDSFGAMRGSMLLVATFVVAACSPKAVVATDDAGSGNDVVTPVDVGAPVDAGSVVDVVAVADAGAPMDVAAPPPDLGTTPADVPSATDAGSILPPWDSGPAPVDPGTLGTPAWAALTLRVGGGCTAAATCGGDVVGTWDVAGGCFDLPVPAELMRCPGAAVTGATGRARGRVAFTATTATRWSQWETEAEVSIPALCAAVAGGCGAVQALVRMAIPDSACVTAAGGACQCAVRQTGSLNDVDTYTVAAGQIVSTHSAKRWNYCITPGAATHLVYDDASTSGVREPGVIDLLRR